MGQRVTIAESYTAQYADPIAFAAGDPLIVQREDDDFPGWHWCIGPDGREGWVHAAFFTRADGAARAVRDYTARELSVQSGMAIELHERMNGWAYGSLADGTTGWVPDHVLGPSLDET
jgi:SH3-like domain-containing protein